MATYILHKKQQNRRLPKQKHYEYLTIALFFIPVLSLITTPVYSTESNIEPVQEQYFEMAVETEVPTRDAAIVELPIQTPEEKLFITQKKVIEVATAELETCGANAIKKYTKQNTNAWCSEFVSWVYKQSGIPFSGGKNTSWILINSDQIENWFRANNRYHTRNSGYMPKRGDYVQTRNSDGTLHSAIIVDITEDPETNKTVFVTIDGNWNNCVKLVDDHSENDILGYGEIAVP